MGQVPQAHFRVSVPLKSLPSLSSFSTAGSMSSTDTHPATHTHQPLGENLCCNGDFANDAATICFAAVKKKTEELRFFSGCEGGGRGPERWTAVVRVTGGKELSQGAWGQGCFEGWPKEMGGRQNMSPQQQMRGCTNRFHPDLANVKCDAQKKEQKALY